MGCSRHYEAFCSATVETFSITFPAGESGPHDTLMHYLSFANSISAVSHSCLQSQQPTRRSLVIHTVWFMYTPVSLQKMSCCSPLPSRHNMAAAICLYLSPHLPSQTLLPFSSSLPNGAFWLPQFHIGPFLCSKWNIYIYIYNPDFASPAPLLDVFLCSYHRIVLYPDEYPTNLFFKYGVSSPVFI